MNKNKVNLLSLDTHVATITRANSKLLHKTCVFMVLTCRHHLHLIPSFHIPKKIANKDDNDNK